ncbi:MAG TPA: DUF4105 domain-containing protein [Gammaproteobacteria bacterium]|nr:DUF4105 domain-containing protein [Gammaproteobacteria bacterium]
MPSQNFYRLLLLTVCIFNLLTAQVAYADSSKKISALQDQARIRQLWLNPEWLKLLHYDQDGTEFISQVDDSNFFYAADGKTNPETEMLATLAAFYHDVADADTQAQCRFPARLSWLNQNLNNQLTDLPTASCALYKEWRASIPDEKLALIFPAYHLNSPSSMFGHTLLRLDAASQDNSSEWLSIAVNFGADVQQGDNSLFYAFKGLSGGYPGFFIVTPYFKKIREYNKDENRDIWEYPLNLQPDEIKKLVTHLWELKEIKFDYYFFDENCSYRLLELLEVARPGIQLTDHFKLTVIPVDTVRVVEKAGLIESIKYRPSQVTVLQELLAQIPHRHYELIERISTHPEETASADFLAIDQAQQKNIIDVAYKLIRYRQGTGPRDETASRNGYLLLEKLNQYAATEKAVAQSSNQPENGHLSSRLTFRAGSQNDIAFGEFGYRMSFHSLDDNVSGFLQGAQINLGNLELRAYHNETIQVQQFDVVDIFSLTPRSDFLKPLSWRIYTGLERQLTNQREVLTAHVTGGVGVAYAPVENNIFYAMGSLRLEHNSEFDDNIEPALGVLSGMLHHFKDQTAHMQIAAEEFANDETRYRASYTHNFVLSTNHTIKLHVSRKNHEKTYFSAADLAYQYYF